MCLLFCLIMDWSSKLAKQMVCSPQWEFFLEWVVVAVEVGGGAVCHLINRLWSIGQSLWSEKSAPSLCTAAFSSFLLSANTKCFSSSWLFSHLWAGNMCSLVKSFQLSLFQYFGFFVFWCFSGNELFSSYSVCIVKIASLFIHIWLGGLVLLVDVSAGTWVYDKLE